MLLKDVFTPGGQPSVTYVERSSLGLEKALKKALAQGYALNVVTGPTKSGKTVLCRRVLQSSPEPFIVIEGGQVRCESDFWTQISTKLELSLSSTVTRTASETTAFGGAVGGGIPGIFKSEVNSASTSNTSDTKSRVFSTDTLTASVRRLLETKTTILIDDFHYIDPDVQRKIIQALKGAVFDGLSAILLAVPHRAFDPITVEDEMQGRFRHIPIPEWSTQDLLQIPVLGFRELNARSTSSINLSIIDNSFDNPLLVQEICSELCASSGIIEAQENAQVLDENLLSQVFEEVAKSKGFPKYRRLREGPQSRKDRQARRLKAGGTADIYEVILMAIGKLGPKRRAHYDEIRAKLRDLVEDDQLPQKHEVTAALSHMSKIAKDKMIGEPPLEFLRDEDALVITDPFLLFYMKWMEPWKLQKTI